MSQTSQIPAFIRSARSLATLLDAIRGLSQDEYEDADLTSLPTFGGPEPRSTEGVWSWDESSLLVGTCRDDFEIVARPRKISVTIDHDDTTYTATLDGAKVTISRDGMWSGDGRWTGKAITDCAANIGDEVYDALDEALVDAIGEGA